MFIHFEVHRYRSPLSLNIVVSDAVKIDKISSVITWGERSHFPPGNAYCIVSKGWLKPTSSRDGSEIYTFRQTLNNLDRLTNGLKFSTLRHVKLASS